MHRCTSKWSENAQARKRCKAERYWGAQKFTKTTNVIASIAIWTRCWGDCEGANYESLSREMPKLLQSFRLDVHFDNCLRFEYYFVSETIYSTNLVVNTNFLLISFTIFSIQFSRIFFFVGRKNTLVTNALRLRLRPLRYFTVIFVN